MALDEVCLSCYPIALRDLLFSRFRWFIPLNDNRVVGLRSPEQIPQLIRSSLDSVRRLCWIGYFGESIICVLGLPNLGFGNRLCATPLIMAGWCAPVSRCSYRFTCLLITATVALTVS